MPRLECPKCGHKFGINFKNGKRRCKNCQYDWFPDRLPLHLSKNEWKKILYWFVREQSSSAISKETGIGHKRVLRALMHVRRAMKTDIPKQFSGIVEVDETAKRAINSRVLRHCTLVHMHIWEGRGKQEKERKSQRHEERQGNVKTARIIERAFIM